MCVFLCVVNKNDKLIELRKYLCIFFFFFIIYTVHTTKDLKTSPGALICSQLMFCFQVADDGMFCVYHSSAVYFSFLLFFFCLLLCQHHRQKLDGLCKTRVFFFFFSSAFTFSFFVCLKLSVFNDIRITKSQRKNKNKLNQMGYVSFIFVLKALRVIYIYIYITYICRTEIYL